jgi:uncharacterized protein (DUF736 family)
MTTAQEKQLTPKEFERTLLNAFRGQYVNPRKISSFNPERLFMLFDERGSGVTKGFSPITNQIPFGRITTKEKNMNQQLGTMKPNSKFKERGSYDLEIHIPFHPSAKFWVQPYSPQDGKETTNHPSMVVFHHGIKVGAMWSKVAKNKDGFFSASIFKLGEEGNSISFNLFPVKSKENDGSETETGDYTVSYWTPGEKDEEEIDHSPK